MRTRTLLPLLLLVSPPVFASTPPPDDEAPKELIDLRAELFETGEKALQQVPRFRALCDAEGYPLVGNVVRKNNVFQPSQFCAAVRSSKA